MSAQDLKAVTRQADHPESFSRPSKLYEDMEALLSPKAAPLNDMLAASPRAEDRLEATLSKIGMLEDMDVQLRSQLEKIIVQRNQLGAEKAARNIEIQHLQAQVELLEADSAGRHHSDSRPGSPRESEPDRIASHVDSLQADNARLQLQVEISSHAVSDLQQQLHDSQQQLHSMSQDAVPSIAMSLESQLRAQVSKSEYEVARQAAQILELQGELTKVQALAAKAQEQKESLQTEVQMLQSKQEEHQKLLAEQQTQLQLFHLPDISRREQHPEPRQTAQLCTGAILELLLGAWRDLETRCQVNMKQIH
ncbi:hypothetical protein WJX79_008448 [Trebouxia sp. C0005]